MHTKLVFSIFKFVIRVSTLSFLGIFCAWLYIAQPTSRTNGPSNINIDEIRLRSHVEKISNEFYPRNYLEVDILNKTAEYIKEHFQKAGAKVRFQEFVVSGRKYKNVIAVFGKGKQNKWIIGAHYDAYEKTHGADDNASGVAGLIELAYLVGKYGIEREIELVAYSLEEPPYFATQFMGSYVHAQSIMHEADDIEGMISLEMIGFYSDVLGSQSYPNWILDILYPNKGDFVAIVGQLSQREFTQELKVAIQGRTEIEFFSLNGPSILPGTDYSDHRNYWPLNINAVMVTDTAFYRNKQYHDEDDLAERLNYKKISQVIVSVFEGITHF